MASTVVSMIIGAVFSLFRGRAVQEVVTVLDAFDGLVIENLPDQSEIDLLITDYDPLTTLVRPVILQITLKRWFQLFLLGHRSVLNSDFVYIMTCIVLLCSMSLHSETWLLLHFNYFTLLD